MTPTLIKSYRAALATAGNRLVAFTGTDSEVSAGASGTALLIGVSDQMGADAGEMLDVVLGGIYPVQLGGSVDAGDPLTADADGKGVLAEPVAGSLVRYACFAMSDGVADDIIPVLVVPGIINTPA
ncbi:capsid cement protein [Breoghania sp.]|uniref:capsid cement protein n=1 Tax=Breoghania sp. TaxID=2065378 RepID=UPI0029C9F693|nr:capsid cement protein [Breoghania sp.]